MQEMQEAQVWFLGQKNPLEKELRTHSNILAWKIPWTEASGELQSTRLQNGRHNWASEQASVRRCRYIGVLFSIVTQIPENEGLLSPIPPAFLFSAHYFLF